MSLITTLMKKVGEQVRLPTRKVTIVGAGKVGTATAIYLLTKGVVNELSFVDINVKTLEGEQLDMSQAAVFLDQPNITYSTDYTSSSCSSLVIIIAGVGGAPGGDRLKLLEKNCDIVKQAVPKILEFSPEATILMVTNPVDVLTYVAWKASGLPIHRVLGSGTVLDSARFRAMLAKKLCLAPNAVRATLIGEHGHNIVPCWSSMSVGGAILRDIYPKFGDKDDPEKWYELKDEIIKTAANIISLKNGTWWATGRTIAHITEQLLKNTGTVLTVTTNVKGMHCIEDDIYMSLPCVLGNNGVQSIIQQKLSDSELEDLHKCVEVLRNAQKLSE